MHNTLIIVSLSVLTNFIGVNSFQCRIENGKPVDWYVMYKLPKITKPKSLFGDGYHYMYMTSEINTWQFSKQLINSNKSILAWTLKEFYTSKPRGFWLSYNDQSAHVTLTEGHTKGVIGADKETGFWLIHSIPHFPNFNNFTYSYPQTGRRNGQSVLCVTFNSSEMDKIGNLLEYNRPSIWRKVLPADLATLYPNLYSAAKGETVKKAPWYTIIELKSKNGFNLTAFAKSEQFGKDLYDLVAQSEKADVNTETWQNEPSPLPPFCSLTYKVFNIRSIRIAEINMTFKSHKDHSKLAISAVPSKPFVCIGDINRALHQEKRGGGTMCLTSKQHWTSYSKLINTKDTC
ncbi:deoxyribonuclease-2-beta [Cimex lectularius]|uniref:Uncharacterized protein n=1 Tax=Cimex lectularius TaxID=79782 RepID=A0A8I6RF77_CIMLE|nr:deoxyribonuclease-2-beta [Cimex lectularius]